MTERTAVQTPLIRYAAQIGWDYVRPDHALALRGGDDRRFFAPILEAQLQRLNPGVVDPARAAEIVRHLTLLLPTIAGNRDALAWLRGEHSVFVPGEHRERDVRLVDFDDPDRNQFHVTDEWWQRGVVHRNRADVVFLLNGVPVAVAETKPTKPDALAEGVDQIRRYHRETPDLFAAAQLFEVTQLVDFWYGATWSTSRKNLFDWKDELPGAPDFERKVSQFFDRDRFLHLLRDYIIFLTKDDDLTKIVLRQHQTDAVEKVVERVHDPAKRRGLIWHTQGSGKTLTMITIASRLLRETSGGEKPTVLMLVDRTELEQQLFRNIAAYGIGTVEVAQTKADLRRLFRDDHRGLVVSMIHKFDRADADLNRRDGIVVLVDEAHRTTGGDLGNYLLAAIPNATYIGFTGTPIDNLASGQGTFKVFGGSDPQGYLDKYSIRESIQDGTTVQLNYALAPSALQVDRDTLERQFLALADAEGLSDLDELNALLDRAVELKQLMKAPSRVDQIAAFVAQHFRQHVEPMGFKAFLVGVDREACALYKQALDRHLPPDYSRVVYSAAHNDPDHLKPYYLDADAEKDLRKEFTKKDTLPKILIVTEKLLTGYDAPILYCMYLDKPMRDHVLLQAIARVNRPYEDGDGLAKPCGFVLDFVGIFEKLERALVHFQADQQARRDFLGFFRRLQDLYDILSPDAFLRPFLDDYQRLSALYALLRAADTTYVDRELTAKTRQLLREQTTAYDPDLPTVIHELGPRQLAALKGSDAADTVKILNLRKLLTKAVEDGAAAKPFLRTISERAEALATAYDDRQQTTQQVLAAFEELAQDYVDADAERQRLGLDENTFAIYQELKRHNGHIPTEQAAAVDALFAGHPAYVWNEQQRTKLRTQLYKLLRPLVGPSHMIDATNAILRLHRVRP